MWQGAVADVTPPCAGVWKRVSASYKSFRGKPLYDGLTAFQAPAQGGVRRPGKIDNYAAAPFDDFWRGFDGSAFMERPSLSFVI